MSIETILVGGRLGSGKSTFITNTILPHFEQQGTLKDLSLIVNEASPLDTKQKHLDGRRLSMTGIPEKNLTLFGQNCVCCDGLESFKSALENIAESDTQYLLIEPTGIANSNSIVEAIESFKDAFFLQHVIYMLSEKHYNASQRHDGLRTASTVCLSWRDLEKEAMVTDRIKAINPKIQILDARETEYNQLQVRKPTVSLHIGSLPKMGTGISTSSQTFPSLTRNMQPGLLIPQTLQTGSAKQHNHESYEREVVQINPYRDINEFKQVIHDIANTVERTKGYIRIDDAAVLSFDGVNGDVSYDIIFDDKHVYDNGEIVAIDQNIPDSVKKNLKSLEEGVNNAVLLKGSPKENFIQEFYTLAEHVETNPYTSQGRTFEGWDTYIGIAEQFEQEYADESLLKEAVSQYIPFMQEALKAVPEDERLTGAIRGLKLLYYAEKVCPESLQSLGEAAERHVAFVNSLQEEDFREIEKGSTPDEYREYLDITKNIAERILYTNV
ncbi:MAG: GTP-binding protein [Candidatus Woesearchaeota archaeon]